VASFSQGPVLAERHAAKLGTRYGVVRQPWLAIIELPIASQPGRHFQFQSPTRTLEERSVRETIFWSKRFFVAASGSHSSILFIGGNGQHSGKPQAPFGPGERCLPVVFSAT
jgi:hypothetical protein